MGGRRERRENMRRLMVEAGVSPALVQAQRVVAQASRVLAGVGVVLRTSASSSVASWSQSV
jgi:hypothetical protein